MKNGIICMNKPQGFTSFDVIAKLRGILKLKRLGHAGTLDPMATGVLPIFVGTATKACDILPYNEKSYRAGFKLGITTDTQDITGTTLTQKAFDITLIQLENALSNFRGDIMQLPPMYSAVSVNGQRLYDLARKGIEIEREPRPIHIEKLEIQEYDAIKGEGTINIECSKGTYIRTIIYDIGEKLGCGATMTSLIRTAASGFGIKECVGFEDIEKLMQENKIDDIIIPIERIFESLPKLFLNEVQTRMYKNGVKLDTNRVLNIKEDCNKYTVYGDDKEFIGTAIIDRTTDILRVDKNFC